MNSDEFLNLFVYSDSLAFRRSDQPQDFRFLYPFALKELIESRLGVRANVVFRGAGAASVPHVCAMLVRDTGYIGGDVNTLNIAIFQCGVVDAAPQPFTYALAPALRLIPRVGEGILRRLVPYRRQLQTLWSYKPTSARRFVTEYARIVDTCRRFHLQPIAVGMPLPTLAIESRSPGFRQSVAEYNELIRRAIPDAFCDVEALFSEATRADLLREDGHHLTEAAHALYAEALFAKVEQLVKQRNQA